jgi:hypothetical protein
MNSKFTFQFKKIITTGLFALVLVFTGNVTNADDSLDKAADQYNKNKSNDRYEVVCKREAPVGSRIKKKVCRTVAMSENSQREIKQSMQKLRTTVGKQP